jgi:hypothetical protein
MIEYLLIIFMVNHNQLLEINRIYTTVAITAVSNSGNGKRLIFFRERMHRVTV